MGWKAAPSPRFWIRVNSVMNGAGKYGSKWGNNMGVIGKCAVPCGAVRCCAVLYESAHDPSIQMTHT
jgi:hypothetical protein